MPSRSLPPSPLLHRFACPPFLTITCDRDGRPMAGSCARPGLSGRCCPAGHGAQVGKNVTQAEPTRHDAGTPCNQLRVWAPRPGSDCLVPPPLCQHLLSVSYPCLHACLQLQNVGNTAHLWGCGGISARGPEPPQGMSPAGALVQPPPPPQLCPPGRGHRFLSSPGAQRRVWGLQQGGQGHPLRNEGRAGDPTLGWGKAVVREGRPLT